MLTIRLARTGKKNKAQFQIVLQEHTVAPGGRHVEILGSYDPHSKKAVINGEKVKYWVEKGAQFSDTAYNLMISQGVISGEKRKVKMPAKEVREVPKEVASESKAEAKSEEKPVETPKVEVKAEEKPKEEIKVAEAPKEEVKTEEKPKEEAKKE